MQNSYSEAGNTNLNIVKEFTRFNDWVYSEVKPFIHGNILEIGSGIGVFSERIVRDFVDSDIILSDTDPKYISDLRDRFRIYKNVHCVQFDASALDNFNNINISVDTVLAINVLEHIEDDVAVLKNIYSGLSQDGSFVILVPAHRFLFNSIDVAIGHFRRYTEKEILHKISQTGFKVRKLFYFNFFAMFGWYINGLVIRNGIVSKNAVSILDILTPLFRLVEHYILRRRMGISLVVILKKDT